MAAVLSIQENKELEEMKLQMLRARAAKAVNDLNSDKLIDGDAFFDELEHAQNRLNILEGIARGEKAALESRVYSEQEAAEKLDKWLK